jgi:hypothetical protein
MLTQGQKLWRKAKNIAKGSQASIKKKNHLKLYNDRYLRDYHTLQYKKAQNNYRQDHVMAKRRFEHRLNRQCYDSKLVFVNHVGDKEAQVERGVDKRINQQGQKYVNKLLSKIKRKKLRELQEQAGYRPSPKKDRKSLVVKKGSN